MSSKWVQFRDLIVESLNLDNITEDIKQNATKNLVETIYPAIEEKADALSDTLKEQAKTETGWVKIRDSLVFPLLISGALYIVENALKKTLKETT